jgi:hypothetical protein
MMAVHMRAQDVTRRGGSPISPAARGSSSQSPPSSRTRGTGNGSRIKLPIPMPTPTGYNEAPEELGHRVALRRRPTRCAEQVRTPVHLETRRVFCQRTVGETSVSAFWWRGARPGAIHACWCRGGRWRRGARHRGPSNPGPYSSATTSIPDDYQRNSADDTSNTSFSRWLTTSRVALGTCSCARRLCVRSLLQPLGNVWPQFPWIVCRQPHDNFVNTDPPRIGSVRPQRQNGLHAPLGPGDAAPLHRRVLVGVATRHGDSREFATCRFRGLRDACHRRERHAGNR